MAITYFVFEKKKNHIAVKISVAIFPFLFVTCTDTAPFYIKKLSALVHADVSEKFIALADLVKTCLHDEVVIENLVIIRASVGLLQRDVSNYN